MENNENRDLKASTVAKRDKKKADREAKAARKAANQVEEKKSRPNNIILAVLIFGVLIGMFVFVKGYNYFSKPANIQSYIEKNGGEETYGNMQIDAYTTAKITAEGNSMTIAMEAKTDDEEASSQIKEFYEGDDGEEQLKYIGGYFLYQMKPLTRAFSADANVSISLNGEELKSASLTFKDAKEIFEKDADDEDEDAEDAADDAEDADDDAEDAADDAADAEGSDGE